MNGISDMVYLTLIGLLKLSMILWGLAILSQ